MSRLVVGMTVAERSLPDPLGYAKQTVSELLSSRVARAVDVDLSLFPATRSRDEWFASCARGPRFPEPGSQLDVVENTNRVIEYLCSRVRDGDFFLALQDDLLFSDGAIETIRRTTPKEGVGAVTFYCPYVLGLNEGLRDYPRGAFYGELAILWRRECAQEFLFWSRGAKRSSAEGGHDLLVNQFFYENWHKWRLLSHNPCVVQHMGEVSTMGNKSGNWARRSPNFREAMVVAP